MNSALTPRPGFYTDRQNELGHLAAAHIASAYVTHNLATEDEAVRMAHAAADAIRLYRRIVEMEQAGPLETRTCRCGMMLLRTGEQPWVHADRDASRGCRAASYTHEHGWDDSLPRQWTARPIEGVGPSRMTIAQVAGAARITQATVRGYLAREQMPPVDGHFGRTPYWDEATIQPWLDARERSARVSQQAGRD